MTRSWLVTIGTSAGGLEAVTRLLAQLPADFPAAIFVVQHLPAQGNTDALLRAVRGSCSLPVAEARPGERFEGGRVYLAPADHHMMLKGGRIILTKGARENSWRPAIDPLFRSAAISYGNRVIGIVLSGYLDDGASGLLAIKRCGGVCVVQDPTDAAYPDMPLNALDQVKADHRVPVTEMGAVLMRLVSRPIGERKPPPEDIVVEARIAERVLSDLPSVNAVGDQAPFNCPGCGGVLWEVKQGDLRYRCHTGHAYTAAALLVEQSERIEETLWTALRMFEERRNLLERMSAVAPKRAERSGQGEELAGNREVYASTDERAKEAAWHIERIRELLRMGDAEAAKRTGR